jgi:hypothetical protein
MQLTDDERRQLADGTTVRMYGGLLRTEENWREILAELTPTDAAARIFGDITCFNPDYKDRRRLYALTDVEQLARALQAWRAMGKPE